MEKFAYAIQMSYPIPDSEKRVAEKASEHFNNLLGRLKLATEHLDLIYDPFKKVNEIDNSLIVEYRDVFRRYRDKVQSNFEAAIKVGFKAVSLLMEVADPNTEQILKAFNDQIKELEEEINVFLSIFENLNSVDFKNNLISSIDSVKKTVNKTRQIINDRILEHIDTNILAKNWISDLSKKYHKDVKERVPLVVELFRERQNALREANDG